MPLDPGIPRAFDPKVQVRQELADLRRRVATLERRSPSVPIVSGTPAVAVADGALAGDTTPRLWLRVGGAWHYTTLT